MMKRRNLLLMLVLAFALFLTACGGTGDAEGASGSEKESQKDSETESEEANPFVGKWKGTLDLTDYVVDAVISGDPTMETYLDLEGLAFVINMEYTEDEIKMSVDTISAETFVTNLETGLIKMLDAMLVAQLEGTGVTVEEAIAALGYDYDTYMKETVAAMNLGAAITEPFIEALAIEATYEYEEDGTLTFYYTDNTYEEFEYAFDGENLTVTMISGDEKYDIKCELVK